MAPRSFLETVVRPNLQEFDADYGNIRRAYNAVAAVDALAAHIYVWCKTNAPSEIAGLNDDSHYRGRLAGCSSDFRLLRDIANAQKHVELDPRKRAKRVVTKSAQVTARPVAYGEGPYGDGRYGGPPQVVVRTDSGEPSSGCDRDSRVDREISRSSDQVARTRAIRGRAPKVI